MEIDTVEPSTNALLLEAGDDTRGTKKAVFDRATTWYMGFVDIRERHVCLLNPSASVRQA